MREVRFRDGGSGPRSPPNTIQLQVQKVLLERYEAPFAIQSQAWPIILEVFDTVPIKEQHGSDHPIGQNILLHHMG